MEATHETTVMYADQCPSCLVRALVSIDGVTATCASCGEKTPPAGLTIRAAFRTGHVWEWVAAQADEPVVYYVRFGDRVKIGTTTNLKQRLANLPCDEVMAVERGSYDVEKERHEQFRAARIYANREWFHLSDDLAAHIATLAASA